MSRLEMLVGKWWLGATMDRYWRLWDLCRVKLEPSLSSIPSLQHAPSLTGVRSSFTSPAADAAWSAASMRSSHRLP